MPTGKIAKIGVWENEKFIGVILYLYGATPHIGSPYKLSQHQIVELTRVALNKHKTAVTRMIAISIKMLYKMNPKLRLIVSYADTDQEHDGGIYKGGNWVYEGKKNENTRGAFIVNGKKIHPRTIGAMGGTQSLTWIKNNMDSNATEFITKGKHKYLMPLDDEMRKQIEPLRQSYPKRPK